MGVYIKNWSLADWKELLKWAKIGANNAMIGEFSEVEEVPPHGRLIDADVLFDFILNIYKNAQGDARKAYRDVLDIIVAAGDVIEAEEGET